ncbi:hypothetical protein PYCC9005_004569 [Savitreella phatthalungensis]
MSQLIAPVLIVLGLGVIWTFMSPGTKQRRKRGPTQHELDPTLKKNQMYITTQKKAFRREDLPPEYLAQLEARHDRREDIVELPMGAPRPARTPQELSSNATNDWLPDHLKSSSAKQRSGRNKRR